MGELSNTLSATISLLSKGELQKFWSLTGARVASQLLDLLGLTGVGFVVASIAGIVSGESRITIFSRELTVTSPSTLLTVTAIVAALFMVKTAFSAWLLKRTVAFLAQIEVSLSSRLAKEIFLGGLRSIRRMKRSELSFTTVRSTNAASVGMLGPFSIVLSETSLLLFVMVGFFLVDWIAASAIVVYLLFVVIVFQTLIGSKLRTIGTDLKASSIKANHAILEMYDSYRELWVSGHLNRFIERFTLERRSQADAGGSQVFFLGVPRYFVESAMMVGVFGLVAWALSTGDLYQNMVSLSVFIAGGLRMSTSLLPLQNAVSALRTNVRLAQPAQALSKQLTQEEANSAAGVDNSEPRSSASIANRGLAVRLEGVWFRFQDSKDYLFENMSFEVAKGSFCALVGPSGSGKTTIADLILGLYQPDLGKVTIDNYSSSDYLRNNPGHVGYVPQRPSTVSATVAQNVAIGVPSSEVDETRVEEVLKLAGLQDRVATLPKGINTVIGERGIGFSGGESQRLGIARAMYTKPKLIILDEATSALDAQREASVLEIIESLRESVTVIVIAHRLQTVTKADNIMVIDGGRLVDAGSFETLRNRSPFFEQFLKANGSVF